MIAISGGTANRYLYCGEQFDPDLGMYYLRARYYQPQTGRFWTMDTFQGDQEDTLSLHKYLYCEANPIDGIDPTGLLGLFKFTKDFGDAAHIVIKTEYANEHPGATVGTTVGLLGTRWKPDILDTPNHVFMEIKPLSLSGVARGVAQIGTLLKKELVLAFLHL